MKTVKQQHSVTHEGRKWKLFTFEYNTPDGKFSSYFYAISLEHAAAIIEDIKETATLTGELI
jgi:hypothetical protein